MWKSTRMIGGFCMKKCNICGVSVHEQHTNCPLCRKALGEAHTTDTSYPDYQQFYREIKDFSMTKLFLFIAIAAPIIALTVNLFTLNKTQFPWSVIVSISVLYAWFTWRYTIRAKIHLGGKILCQFFALSILLFTIDRVTGFHKWSTDYIIPALSVGATLFVTLIAVSKKTRWDNYMGYLLATFFTSPFPICLYFFGLADILWPSFASLLTAGLTLIGLIVFSDRKFKEEMKKRFHL